jgi:hypothetical protein
MKYDNDVGAEVTREAEMVLKFERFWVERASYTMAIAFSRCGVLTLSVTVNRGRFWHVKWD